MDEKYHLIWANAGATVRNVSRLPRAVFVLVRPRSGPSASGRGLGRMETTTYPIRSKIHAGVIVFV